MKTSSSVKVTEYLSRVTRGEGFMPWQKPESVSPKERRFRATMERRKDTILSHQSRTNHPVLLSSESLATARRNIARTSWGKAWFEGIKTIADHVAGLPDSMIDHLIPGLTPTSPYGFTCPNCVYTQSQEGMGVSMFDWNFHDPDRIRCNVCGQSYPDKRFPETGTLVCPRRDQTFTYYLNDAERAHPRDRSGKYAYHWVKKPIHVSFSGIIREKQILFMLEAVRALGLAYQLTSQPRYAQTAVHILQRFTACVGNWLYHDYWDTMADCDPLYAAWHDHSLQLEWKRHPCTQAYADVYESGKVKDSALHTRMLVSYWGCGRIHPSADAWMLNSILPAYDMVYDARDTGGHPLWTDHWRRRVERDLILEYAMGAEPFLGGAGKADNLTNKSPYVYLPFAFVGRVLGLAEYADVALRGYENLRDGSFIADGFTNESPAYTVMYLANLIKIPEVLHGYRWPRGFNKRKGAINLYRSDPKLRLMIAAVLDALRTNGKYLPLSDTLVIGAPNPDIFEIALNRYPDRFTGALPTLYRGQEGYRQSNISVALTRDAKIPHNRNVQPGEYAVFNLQPAALRKDRLKLPEILFPAWQTAILRHGDSVAALPFNPAGVHRHADNLALYYADCGQPLLGELGYVGDSAMLAWGGSTLSHNLVVVDNADQVNLYRRDDQPDPRQPSLRLMVSTPRLSVVEADSKAYPQCEIYCRLIVMLKGPDSRTLLVDIFRVKGGNQHAYRLFSELASNKAPDSRLTFSGLNMPPEVPLPDFGGSTAPDHVFGLRDCRTVRRPPDTWQACWQEGRQAYRLHVLCPVNAACASHGPGQETTAQVGRRLRYLDLVNSAPNLTSTFVTIHEPCGPGKCSPVRSATRLIVPASAGPDAVALQVETAWGTIRIFNEFLEATEIAGTRFQGRFGAFGQSEKGTPWHLIVGENEWTGTIKSQTATSMTTHSRCPTGWPALPDKVTAWVRVGDGARFTGYPVQSLTPNQIIVDRFPLQPAKHFSLPSVQYRG